MKQTPVTEEDNSKHEITAPGFDHAVGDPVPGAIVIKSTCRVVVVEGNYTLLLQEPWNEIASLAEERYVYVMTELLLSFTRLSLMRPQRWFVDVPRDIAKDRLAARHLAAGISRTREEAIHRAEGNDLPNGDLVRANLIEPDVRIIN